ncbi:MAG: glycosyltransferase family 39 protein [Deltaproteobacteria bacterium]|nr:glycosyltransferase family 39 protein [Deltaproteobacteria bacterium]
MVATPSYIRKYRADIIISLLLCLMILAVYGQVVGHRFVNFDDNVYVTDNAQVRNGWSLDGLKWAFTTDLHGHWHPLTWLSHMTDVQGFGMNPAGHHLTNAALHLASTLLLFFLLRRMTGVRYRSALVAALFALHPLHVETVAWVADRKDVLAGFFFMLTLLAYVSYTERRTLCRYLLALVCFSLALMSKTIAVTAPAVMLLLDFWPLGRFPVATTAEDRADGSTKIGQVRQAVRLVLEKWGFFLPAVARPWLHSWPLRTWRCPFSSSPTGIRPTFRSDTCST